MSTYDKIAWLPLCGGLTGLGLVLSYLTGRKRGIRAMIRGAAWSLLPLAAYLTGAIEMFWKIGVAIGDFAKSFAFSPRVWSGIAVAAVAVVLFAVTGGMRRRGKGAKAKRDPAEQAPGGSGPSSLAGPLPAAAITRPQSVSTPGRSDDTDRVPARRGKPAKKGRGTDDDPEAKEIDEILRRHGIT